MNRSIISLSLICLAITGCSTVSKKSAIGDFDYASKDEASTLVIPQSLAQPNYKNDFVINNNINHKGPVGEQVDVRAPSLVLPIASASRIENDNEQAKIWFDKVLEDKDLQVFVYQAIVDELASQQATLSEVDADKLMYQTSWITVTKESGWLVTSIDETVRMKFNVQLETKPHGRSVAAIVGLADYAKTDESGETSEIDLIDKHRLEIAMLNQVVSQVDFKYRSFQRDNQLLRAKQQLVSIEQDDTGQASYLVEMESDMLWSNMPILFSKYGFDVNDLNESKQVYYVTYKKLETSVWDSLWGDDAPVIGNLAEGKYQFHLSAQDNSTLVTLKDEAGNALSKSQLETMFDAMSLALSFKDSL